MLKLVISEACRYTCQQLRDLRCSWLPEPGVRDVIRSLGCARRRCGRRAGNRARDRCLRALDVNNNTVLKSADRSTFHIPTLVTTWRLSVGKSARHTYHGYPELRTTERRELISDVRGRHEATSSATVIGLLNARSVSGKSTAIYDRIVADRLHLCALVETWHDAVDSPQLIASTPPGYRYLEKARPRAEPTSMTTSTNHGGLSSLRFIHWCS